MVLSLSLSLCLSLSLYIYIYKIDLLALLGVIKLHRFQACLHIVCVFTNPKANLLSLAFTSLYPLLPAPTPVPLSFLFGGHHTIVCVYEVFVFFNFVLFLLHPVPCLTQAPVADSQIQRTE